MCRSAPTQWHCSGRDPPHHHTPPLPHTHPQNMSKLPYTKNHSAPATMSQSRKSFCLRLTTLRVDDGVNRKSPQNATYISISSRPAAESWLWALPAAPNLAQQHPVESAPISAKCRAA